MRTARRTAVTAAAAALAIVLTSCAISERGAGTGESPAAGGATGGTLVFGVPGAPKVFDPFFASDGETFRPSRQMYDTLITHKRGTAQMEPGLALEWTPNDDFTEWTFKLRPGVKFHDGTDFNAEAVCFNFNRWANLSGPAAQSQAIYYNDVFDGFANNQASAGKSPVFKSCASPNPTTAVVGLNKAKGAFPAAFALTALSMSSPAALQKYNGDKVEKSGAAFTYSEYATAHPTGTGPFVFESFDRAAGLVTMVRNDKYWGEKAKVDKLIFKVISDENARKQELRAGTIDGYDYPASADWNSLRGEGYNVLVRPPFNILYLGINQKNNPALKDLRVRQAIAYALDRDSLVRQMSEGAVVATQFLPEAVSGFAPDLQPIPYDPAKAKQLLAEAGQSNLTVNFYYPTEVSRPYMPNPTNIFAALSENLRQVGITVNPVPQPWTGGYLDSITVKGAHDLHLIGWTGDYNDAGNFVGSFFGRAKPEFGLTDQAIFDEIAKADAIVNPAEHAAAYQQVNRDLMTKYLPAVPVSSSPPALVVRRNITGLIPTPLTDERYSTVSKG